MILMLYAAHVALTNQTVMGQVVLLAKHWAGGGWQTLSIPRGKSAEFTRELAEKMGRS